MELFLLNIRYQVFSDSISQMTSNVTELNLWFWLALFEFIILGFLALRLLKQSKLSNNRLKKEILNEDVDFDNIIESSFNAEKLFDELKVKCHPDRFTQDKVKNDIANELYQRINESKNNIKGLIELQKEAVSKLRVSMKNDIQT